MSDGGCGCGKAPCAPKDDRREREAIEAGGPPPAWARPEAAAATMDARPRVAAGEHPAAEVMASLDGLSGAQVFQLLTPFVPRPLLERARGRGFLAHSVVEGEDLVRTFFRRPEP